jgi:hypothetical protein
MPTARELLEQAEALMRRNRAGAIDTEIPELTEVVPAVIGSPPAPTNLDDVPELTDIVEEIEIASIAELPDEGGTSSEWLRIDRDGLTLAGLPSDSVIAMPPPAPAREQEVATAAAATATVAAQAPDEATATAYFEERFEKEAPTAESAAVAVEEPFEKEAPALESAAVAAEEPFEQEGPAAASPAPPVEEAFEREAQPAESSEVPVASLPERDAVPGDGGLSESPLLPVEAPAAEADATPVEAESAVAGDDWARWQALAEEIRMQVLQRIDIFTDTALREQLGAQLQPIVDRASAEMIETINREVGTLLRAYIAEAIEREIEKWRKGNT